MDIICFIFQSENVGKVFVFETSQTKARNALKKIYGSEVFVVTDVVKNMRGIFYGNPISGGKKIHGNFSARKHSG